MLNNQCKYLLLAFILLLPACSHFSDQEQPGQDVSAHFTSDQREAETEQPAVVTDIAEEETEDSAQQDTPGEPERFYVSVKDTPARDFFLGLMDGTAQNIVVHPKLDGNVSLELQDVTLTQVLNVCRDIYGYAYEWRNGMYTIYPRELHTEIFPINYPDLKRVGVSDTSVLVGEIVSGDDDGNTGSSSGGSKEGSLLSSWLSNTAEGGGGNTSVAGTRVQTLTQTDFWGGLRTTIMAMIEGDKGDRMVVVSPHSSTVIVKAYPQELNKVRNFLERAELTIRRQVILEAKILEVGLYKNYEAGINWAAITGQAGLFKNVGSLVDDVLVPNESAGEVFASAINIKDISELLRLLETQGEVQVLSSPRIATVNNQKAIIKVGSDEFFVTGISSTTTSNSAAVSSTPNVELTSFFSGIALDVTPQISENKDVILHIHPVISDVNDQQKNFVVGDDRFSLPLALRGIRESDSIVRAQSGQVIVLGGLMQDNKTKENQRRPLISRIPLIGPMLFSGRQQESLKNELVILLRPIVIDKDDWSGALSSSQGYIENIQSGFRAVKKARNEQ